MSSPYGNPQVRPPAPQQRYSHSQGNPPSSASFQRQQVYNNNNNNQNPYASSNTTATINSHQNPYARNNNYNQDPNANNYNRPDEDDSDRGDNINHTTTLPEDSQPPAEVFEDEDDTKPRYKYSTANMHRKGGKCKKYCCIILMFLVMMGISVGISILIQKIFFPPDKNPPATPDATRDPNDPFPEDKSDVDGSCSSDVTIADGGMQCKASCQPNYFGCCNPFNAFKLFDMPNDPAAIQGDFNLTCSLDTDTRGCVSYSRCQALKYGDAAKNALSDYCTAPKLLINGSRDGSCRDICDEKYKCCYDTTMPASKRCDVRNFPICLDYAPCQNLRTNITLQTAPLDLDKMCLKGEPECGEHCESAKCCNLDTTNATEPSCFADNVITCLTYAACSDYNMTSTNITLPPQFSVVPPPPTDLQDNCDVAGGNPTLQNLTTCTSQCEESSCCRDSVDNCFLQDPLGCMEWNYQCSVVNTTR